MLKNPKMLYKNLMNSKIFLALDQGTSSTKLCAFDDKGTLLWKKTTEHEQIAKHHSHYEHNPVEIVENCRQLINEWYSSNQMKSTETLSSRVVSLSITNQRETLVAWDKTTGKPLYNAIVWLDGRTEEICNRLINKYGTKDHFKPITGLPINTYFSLFKLIWLLENVKEVEIAHENGTLLVGNIDSWLIYNLSKEHRESVHVNLILI